MKRFLITTALEETWRSDKPVLFLGDWCRLNSRKERWSTMDGEVVPYHWDDRAKLYADYQYLQEFYERLLRDLTVQLNEIHRVDHSLQYWRILIGPWLGYFAQMLFDRWESIQQAVSRYEVSGTIVLTGQEEALVPNGMADFFQLFCGDPWNHHLYADIIGRFTKVSCLPRTWPRGDLAPNTPPVIDIRRKLKRTLAVWFTRIASSGVRDRDAFFLATSLPFLDDLRMQLRLGQLPQRWRPVPPVRVEVEWDRRQWILAGDCESDFETCARALIPRHIPAIYLDGYRRLLEQAADLPWPRQPKLIWTSNSFNGDDVFKAWASEKVEQGTPLLIGQHGGHYGVGQWSFAEDHEIAISQSYLSWGWTEAGQPKVKPVGQLKAKRPLRVRHAEQERALLVTAVHPRYSYWMYSTPIASQWVDYFTDQFRFVERLSPLIRNVLTVRLYSQDWGWDQVGRWRERFPELRLDEGQSNINELIRQSRLCISTYNATTFLESFTMDVPTVIYWNPARWELRDSAIPYFEALKRVGIFHETPESAAHQVETIWDDVSAWWTSPAVRAVRERFKARYSYLPDDLLTRVEAALREALQISANSERRPVRENANF